MEYEKLRRKYKRKVKENMLSLNVYQSEFDTLIDVYSGILAQYEIITKRLVDENFNIEVETQRGGNRKSATATAQEKLRTDLILYSDRLMLNPKALNNSKPKEAKKKSALNKFLSDFEKGE